MASENETIFGHIQNAAVYSWEGFKAAWTRELAFRIEAVVIALMLPIGIWIGETTVDCALLIASGLAVLIVELLNSALESVVDRIGPEHHVLSKRAKDMGSAAAALSMLTAAIVWGLIAYARLLN